MKKVFTLILSSMLLFSTFGFNVYAEEEWSDPEPSRSEYPVLFCDQCGSQLYIFNTTPTHYWMRCPRGCMGDDWIEVLR